MTKVVFEKGDICQLLPSFGYTLKNKYGPFKLIRISRDRVWMVENINTGFVAEVATANMVLIEKGVLPPIEAFL